MLILLNVVALLTLLLILMAVTSRNDFWVRFLGEMYHGIGIAMIAGAAIGYFLSSNVTQFMAFFVLGAISLILGVMLVLTSEALLVNSGSSKTILSSPESAY